METLHSLHPIDLEVGEAGSTVRRGFKWADRRGDIDLCVCGSADGPHQLAGHGEILSQWVGRFKDIPARLIRKEHELSSRNYDGLMASMSKAYPGFTEQEWVTVLTYRRTA